MKNVLLTGASRGLGLEVCSQLLSLGYTVYAVSRTESKALLKLKKTYKKRLLFKSADLSQPQEAQKAIFSEDFISFKIKLFGVVHNAASAYDDIATNLNLGKLETMFNVNVFSPMLITKSAIKNMILHKTCGSIVGVSSISVKTGFKGLSMYAASKGALEAFSKNISREWGAKGIRSNIVAPGFMPTEMTSSLSKNMMEKISKRNALQKDTDIKSVAAMICHLLSEKSNSITGQIISVDSGAI